MKIKVQAQHLQPGDIVGSGEVVFQITLNSTQWKANKCYVALEKDGRARGVLWGKYTQITIDRPEKSV